MSKSVSCSNFLVKIIKLLPLFIYIALSQECPIVKELVSSFQFLSCEKGQMNSYISGKKILEDQIQEVSKLTFVGWYSLKGNLSQKYQLFSAFQDQNDHIFSLSYDPRDTTFYSQVFNESEQAQIITSIFPSEFQESWFFLRIGINLKQDNIPNYKIYYLIESDSYLTNSPHFIVSVQQTPYIKFDNQKLQLLYGQAANYPYSSACSFTKKVAVYIGIANGAVDSLYNKASLQERFLPAELVLQINYSILSNEPNTLINVAHINSADKFVTSYNLNTLSNQQFKLGPFNFYEQNGIIIQFDIRFNDDFTNAVSEFFYLQPTLLSITSKYTIEAQLVAPNTIQIKDYCNAVQVGQLYISVNVWTTITIIFSIDIGQLAVRQLFVDNAKIIDDQLYNLQLGTFNMGFFNSFVTSSQPLKRIIQLKQIKLYQGSYYETCGNCLMSMRKDQEDCLVCKNTSDYIIQKNNSYCQATACPSGYFADNNSKQCEWLNGATCPIQGQFRFFRDECSCPPGFYSKDNDCLICPDYCITCTSDQLCIDYVFDRPHNGICMNGHFDDGVKCISKFLKIPNRKNTLGKTQFEIISCASPINYVASNFLIKDNALNLKDQNESFFLSFTFKLDAVIPIIIQTTYTICYIMDQTQNIFTLIAIIKNVSPLIIDLQLYSQQQLLISAPIDNFSLIWIGFLFSLSKIKLIVKQERSPISTYNYQYVNNPINQLIDAELYYGGMTTSLSQYPLCGYIFSYQILKGHNSMFDFPNELAEHQLLDLENYVNFYFPDYSEDTIKITVNIPQISDPTKLFFTNQVKNGFNQLQGLQFSQNSYGQINFFKFTAQQFSFSFVFSPSSETNYPVVSLFYTISPLIEFKILPHKNNYRAIPQICIQQICKNFRYAKVHLNEANFVFVRVKVKKNGSIQDLATFDLVLNYQFERIQIETNISLKLAQQGMLKLQFGENGLSSIPQFYLSSFSFYFQGYFYLDYDIYDPCFLYIDRQNMKCLHPKQGYALLNNDSVIAQNLCNQGRDDNQTILFYNPFTFRCQDSKIVIPRCLGIAYDNLQTCFKCKDPSMDENNKCSCRDGYFYEKYEDKCLRCSPFCSTCKDKYDNCLTCNDPNAKAPKCTCPNQNQYYDENYFCQTCDPQCQECALKADYCTVCNDGRIEIPICRCDNRFYSNKPTDLVSDECQAIECDFKCKTCMYTSDNCISCRGDRQGVLCECLDGKYEDPFQQLQYCSSCQIDEYYDTELKQCILCSPFCRSCFGSNSNNCLTCESYQRLSDQNECDCYEGFQMIEVDQNSSECFQFTNLLFDFKYANGQYQIMIQFEEEVDDLYNRLLKVDLQNLMELRINEVDKRYYGLQKKFFVNYNRQLILFLEIKKSFQATSGQFIFKDNKFFKNTKKKVVLDPVYTINPFIFNIGPYLFNVDEKNQNIIDLLSQLTLSNSSYLSFLQKFQFLLYVINSVQPTAMFLLVKTNIPINLYAFLKMTGIFVYNVVPDYQQESQKKGFMLFGQNVDEYIKSSGNTQFNRLGFTDCLIVSCEIIFYKYLFLIFAIFLAKGFMLYNCNPQLRDSKINHNKSQNENISYQNAFSLYTLLIQKLSQENEVNMMILILSALINLSNIDSLNWLNRWSTYATIMIISLFIGSSIYLFTIYNSSNISQTHLKIVEHFYLRLKMEIQQKGKIAKNYNFICQIKKLLLISILFFLVESPIIVCWLGVILNISTAILTLYLLPYKYLIQSIIKVIGDLLLSTAWIFMILFLKFNETYKGKSIIPQNEIDKFLNIGFYAIICLAAFNLLFFINFVFEGILLFLYQLIIKPKPKYYLEINKKNKAKKDQNQLIPLNINSKQIKAKAILV